jgi:hypothetical protein
VFGCCLIKQFKVIKCYIYFYSCETRCVNFFTIIDGYSHSLTTKKYAWKNHFGCANWRHSWEKERICRSPWFYYHFLLFFETIMKANARPYSHFELLPMVFNVVLYRYWMTIADINYRLLFGDKLIFLLCNVNVCTLWSLQYAIFWWGLKYWISQRKWRRL